LQYFLRPLYRSYGLGINNLPSLIYFFPLNPLG